jgi:hypothetical protein
MRIPRRPKGFAACVPKIGKISLRWTVAVKIPILGRNANGQSASQPDTVSDCRGACGGEFSGVCKLPIFPIRGHGNGVRVAFGLDWFGKNQPHEKVSPEVPKSGSAAA